MGLGVTGLGETGLQVCMKWEQRVKEYADQVQLVSGCLLETSEKVDSAPELDTASCDAECDSFG
jgi:hypothetical protein